MSSSPSQKLPPTLRDPSTLFYQSNGVRRSVIASYWLVIFLGLPLWWYATSIERLSLPTSRIHADAQRRFQIPVHVCVEDGSVAPTLQILFHKQSQADSERWDGVSIRFYDRKECPEGSSYLLKSGSDFSIKQNELFLPLSEEPKLTSAVNVISNLVNPSYKTFDQHRRVMQYSPRYRLAFTLLNEDASAGSSISNWSIDTALSRQLQPILDELKPLHNFTIESQVQYHGRLAFEPQVSNEESYGLTPEHLAVFVNSAEWSLSSSASSDPVIHFVLFIPAPTHRPLHILASDGTTMASKSFLLPQWGGIAIHNPPVDDSGRNSELTAEINDQVFREFSRQLLSLLGVPPLPSDVQRHFSDPSVLSPWQVDSVMRRRALENARSAQDTLSSIIKLVDQIENMPVKEDVRTDIQDSLDALEKMFILSSRSLRETFKQSAIATTLASRAFFNPGMLALLYFPTEHKYVVYTPLFASALIPLFVAALKEIRAWRQSRRSGATKPKSS